MLHSKPLRQRAACALGVFPSVRPVAAAAGRRGIPTSSRRGDGKIAGLAAAGGLKREARLEKPNAIGELNERSLHRALKARYATPGSVTEQAVDGFVADVMIGDRIVEVHTGSFWPLKKKLPRLLERFAVTLVYPVAQDRYIVTMPDGAGAQGAPPVPPVPPVPVAPAAPAVPVAAPVPDDRGDGPSAPIVPLRRRKSPKHDSVFAVFDGLTSIPTLLEHPNLTLDVVMTVEEDVRVKDSGPRGRGPGRRRRYGRGWTRIDRRLVEVARTHRLTGMADLFALVDAGLPEPFTTLDLARTMRSPRRLGQQAAFCFRTAGVSEICGKAGNALLYRRAARG